MPRGIPADRALKRDASRLRRLLQAIGKENSEMLDEIKDVLKDGADSVEAAIIQNIYASGAVDSGDLAEAVGKVRRSSGLQWRVGFFRSGNIRKWRKAGWRAHFIEHGTKHPNQPAYRPVHRARLQEVPHIVTRAQRAVNRTLRRVASRNRARGVSRGQ